MDVAPACSFFFFFLIFKPLSRGVRPSQAHNLLVEQFQHFIHCAARPPARPHHSEPSIKAASEGASSAGANLQMELKMIHVRTALETHKISLLSPFPVSLFPLITFPSLAPSIAPAL